MKLTLLSIFRDQFTAISTNFRNEGKLPKFLIMHVFKQMFTFNI